MAMVVMTGRGVVLRAAFSPYPPFIYSYNSSSTSFTLFRCSRPFSYSSLLVRCFSSSANSDSPRAPARLAQTQRLLQESEAHSSFPHEPVPKVSLEHVTVNFARSGGPGGQNVNKVNTKVDMRFNVMEAHWLPERIRQKLMQLEKNRINSQGELVISSTKSRTQKGNIEDALSKLQALVDTASYIPPPPSEDTKKKINRLAKIENEKRLDAKKKASLKKASRRASGWD